jgi:hypothetical protein
LAALCTVGRGAVSVGQKPGRGVRAVDKLFENAGSDARPPGIVDASGQGPVQRRLVTSLCSTAPLIGSHTNWLPRAPQTTRLLDERRPK